MKEELNWEVVAICHAETTFFRLIAAFGDPYQAQEFIEKVLPQENRSRFFISHRITGKRWQML